MKVMLFIIILMCTFGESIASEIEDAVFAIFKLSYNNPGESNVVGGLCGTAFLISNKTFLTANHILNNNTMIPNSGYKYCQFWLLKRGTSKLIIPFKDVSIDFYPDIESTLIKLKKDISGIDKIEIENIDFNIGDEIYNIGFVGGSMPDIKIEWIKNELIIKDYFIKDGNKADGIGNILKSMIGSVKTNDINLDNIVFIQPSFSAIQGMSGGPLLKKKDNKLIGLMSFGLPADSVKKDTVYAVSINEIIHKFFTVQIKY
jgi:hypothetical protein